MSLNSPEGEVILTSDANATFPAVELGVLIGRQCVNVPAEEAIEKCVLGYTTVNAVRSQWWKDHDNLMWAYSGSFDTFTPIGPVVHKDELGDASGLNLSMMVNGKLIQQGNTFDMIYGVSKLIEIISLGTTIEVGTLILTGTPSTNVSLFLQPGDRVVGEVTSVGKVSNQIAIAGPALSKIALV